MESGEVRLGGKYVEKSGEPTARNLRIERLAVEVGGKVHPSSFNHEKRERGGEGRDSERERERRREGEGEEEREKEKRRGGILSRAEFERRFTEEGRSVSNEIFSRLRDRIFNQFRESDERSSEATQLIPGFSSRPLVLESLTRFRAKNVWRAKDRFGFLA